MIVTLERLNHWNEEWQRRFPGDRSSIGKCYPLKRWQFWIDVGGTFTDCIALTPEGELRQCKTLSSGVVKGSLPSDAGGSRFLDPLRTDAPDGFWKGWTLSILPPHSSETTSPVLWQTRVLSSSASGLLVLEDPIPESCAGKTYQLSCDEPAPLICLRQLLEIPIGQPLPAVDIRMGTTRGTNALLERKGARTAFLVTRGFKDLLRIGNQDRPELFSLDIRKPEPLPEIVAEIDERLSADGQVRQPLDESTVREQLLDLKREGMESVAICLLHAYLNPVHELRIEELAREAGFLEVSRSSMVAPLIKAVPRAETTVLDAYLNPILRTYVSSIRSPLGEGSTLKLMGSQGGLIDGREFSGRDSILSGPAGGVIAFAALARQHGFAESIGFDMGGTSTDVSRFGGRFELESEAIKAGLRIASSVLAIETVAAGGGSICQFDGVQLRVGPQSAGANPGPACYGSGGPLTITDVNLALGRVLPERFPFQLDEDAVHQRLDAIRQQMAESGYARSYSREELAQGFIDIANETMARAIRQISVQKGYDPAKHLFVCFGGAGGQHACALARILSIKSILIHPFAGLLSAYGMGLADIRRRAEQTVQLPYSPEGLQELEPLFLSLEQDLQKQILDEGVPEDRIGAPVRGLSLRYQGVESALLIEAPPEGDYRKAFEQLHRQQFGYLHQSRPIEVIAVATELTGRLERSLLPILEKAEAPLIPTSTTTIWFQDRSVEAEVYLREQLRAEHIIAGPAIVCDDGSTIWIEPGFQAEVQERGELLISLVENASFDAEAADSEIELDPVQLEIFNHRFASIAEQMGVTLRKTSISTNVKERLDYSCALFDAQGGLVVNAPHIPVHLGAMGETVRCLLKEHPVLQPGDVYLTNDPYSGGSHLPDLTVVTPVHDPATGDLLFLTASRAHHAEIGGITPGSMPPFSRKLGEEGILISNFKLMDQGESRMEELRGLLTSGPFPSRKPADNLADITAQIAANQIGAQLLIDMVSQYSRRRVLAYMGFIQDAAETKMKRALAALGEGVYERTDHLDDGSPITVRISIRNEEATIDFTGTGPVLESNLNANRAIVTAAVMYVFRCLIDEPIPLNSGVLRPIEIILPECLLNPPILSNRAECAAMVGGNVETSQRVVDVLLGALGLAAASQGTMNNLTFGDQSFGYYETICGGAGATSKANGADAVHTHMTNTRLTDVEIFESRYPVRILEFSIRTDSSGAGQLRGGEGIRRTFEFDKPLQVSLLTQRRGPFAPFGLNGGEPGGIGINQYQRAGSNAVETLSGSAHIQVQPGDRLTILTPGGGGFGPPPVS